MKLLKMIRNGTDSFKELLALYLGILIISSILYSIFEGKDFFTSLWWAEVTALTIGYGDAYPITLGGRLVASFLIHVVPLFIVPLTIIHMMEKVRKNKNEFTDKEQRQMQADLKWIKEKLGG